MFYEPIECENIIVGIKWKGEFNWYVSEKEMWFMNETLFPTSDKDVPPELIPPDDPRYQLEIVDENTVDIFMPRIEKFKVPVDELCELLELNLLVEDISELSEDTICSVESRGIYCDFMPSLYIDFDERMIISMYQEPASFEDYTPAGWIGKHGVFIPHIDKKYWYWYKHGKPLVKYEERTEDRWIM